jgi:hypothetical protein
LYSSNIKNKTNVATMSSAVGMNLMPTTFHGLAASADTNGNLNSQQGQQQVQPSGVKDKHGELLKLCQLFVYCLLSGLTGATRPRPDC